MSWDFFLTSLIVVVMPGTGVAYTLAATLGQGMKAGCIAATGCTLGVVPHMATSILGVAALLHASTAAFEILKLLGVAFLLWTAWRVWRGRGAIRIDPQDRTVGSGRLIVDGILLNLLNPKLPVFFLAFLPQFVDPGRPDAEWQMSLLALFFMAMTQIVFVVYAAFAASLRRRVIDSPTAMAWLRNSLAASFAALGLRLAFQRN